MSNPALQTVQVRNVAQDILVGHSNAADRAKFIFFRLFAPFLLEAGKLPVAKFGDQRGAYRGGRTAGGPGKSSKGFELDHVDVDCPAELNDVNVSREKGLEATSLGSNRMARLAKYRALKLMAGVRELMVFFELKLLTFLTTIANWHPTASATVAEAARWSEATADVYGQIYGIVEATGADCLVMDQGSWLKASTHPKVIDKLGDNRMSNLNEEEFVALFKRVLPSLEEVIVVRSVGDPDNEKDYLTDGNDNDGNALPHFCLAVKTKAGGAGRNLMAAMDNGAVPTLDVAAVACVKDIEGDTELMSRIPTDDMAAFSILPPTQVGPTILNEDWKVWAGLNWKVLKAKRGALLRATYV